MKIFSSLILAGSSFLFVKGLLYYYSEKMFTNLFAEAEKCAEFDLDYIQNIADLPLGKTISLCAQTDNDDESKKISKVKSTPVLFSSLVETNPGQDKIWKIDGANINFKVRSMQGDIINIISQKENEIFLYNLKKLHNFDQKDPEAKKIKLNFVQQIKYSMGKSVYFTEYAILPETYNVFIGSLNKDIRGNYNFKPKVILGENRSLFLKYLDEHIVSINKNGKRTLAILFGLIFLETSRKIIFKQNNLKNK